MNRFLWPFLRVLITVALLWWITRDPIIRAQLAALPAPPAPGWLLPAWLAGGVNELAGGLRWWLCLRIAGVPLNFLPAAALHFLGLFSTLFLPGTAGGDAAKIAAVIFWHPRRKIGGALAVLPHALIAAASRSRCAAAPRLYEIAPVPCSPRVVLGSI